MKCSKCNKSIERKRCNKDLSCDSCKIERQRNRYNKKTRYIENLIGVPITRENRLPKM